MSALSRVVREARLSDTDGQKHRFTVSRAEAILAARSRPRGPWDFSLPLVRAAVALSRHSWVAVSVATVDDEDAITFDFGVPGAELEELPIAGLLLASLEAERDHDPEDPEACSSAWRRLTGSGINAILADDPEGVELRLPSGGRRWVRADISEPNIYAEQASSERSEEGRFTIRITRRRQSLAGNIRSWFVGRGDPLTELWALWKGRLIYDFEPKEGVVPLEEPEVPRLPLGAQGWFTARDDESALWLVRQGVRLVRLGPANRSEPAGEEEGTGGGLRGWVAFRDVTFTVDEDRLVEDDAHATLTAWLTDVSRSGLASGQAAVWPEVVDSVATAAGPEVSVEDLGKTSDGDGEVLYVWRPDADRVPIDLRHRVLAVWPSQLEVARRQRDDLTWIPLRVLGPAATAPRANLSAVAGRAFEPQPVQTEPLRVSLVRTGGDAHEVVLQPTVRAYVHRYPGDLAGVVMLLAFGRRVAKVTDSARVMPGVTLVASLAEGAADFDIAELLSNVQTLREVADHVVDAAWTVRDQMLGTAMARLSGFDPAWHVPLIRAELENASGATLGLHYVEGPDSEAYLAWRSDPLLALDVGRTLEGRPCRLVDALYRMRDVGGIVVGDAHRRWFTLESRERNFETWVLHPKGRELVKRILGPSSIWEMPIVPEALPRPIPAADQEHLLLDTADVARRLERFGSTPTDRIALQGHLIVARITGRDEHGLGSVRLFTCYDPRALTARSWVSLEAMESLPEFPLLAPVGSAGRWLPRLALEVQPGIAHLLDELREPQMAPPPQPGRERADELERLQRPTRTVTRSLGSTALATTPVADRLAMGALHVDPQADEIVLWARGLRVGSFRIPSPLRAVSGRLWLTDAGIAAGHGRVLAVAIDCARELLEQAEIGASLSPPGSQRRRGLESFVLGVHQAVVGGHDRLGLMAGRAVPKALGPPPMLRGGPDLWLGQLVRHCLGRQVQLDSAWFSWRAARVVDPGFPGRIELGRLDRWIRRAQATDAQTDQVLMAAALVLGEIIDQAPAWGPLDLALERLLVAAAGLPG